MVGITMALAIAICIFGAAGVFAWLSRPFSDLIPAVAPAAQVAPAQEPAAQEGGGEAQQAAPAIEIETEPTAAAAAAATAPASEAFAPTHQISSSGESVNFRAGPSTADAIVSALPPATPLQYLNEDAPTENPNDGNRWMRFRIQNGAEGWVREIDTESYQP
jgi:hypothetical protein